MKKSIQILGLLTWFLLTTNKVFPQEVWQTIGYMQYPVSGAEAVAFDDKIYILGGYADSPQLYVDWIQEYNPISGEWQIVNNMSIPRYNFVAGVYDDKIYYIGCQACCNTPSDTDYSYLEYWDPILNETSDPLPVQGLEIVSPLCGFIDGNELVIHGYIFYGGEPKSLVKINLDTRAVIFSVPQIPPFQDAMISKINGDTYLFGGADYGILDKIYILDEPLGEFVELPVSLSTPRAGGKSVTNVNTNEIYIIGGYNENNYAMNIVESFKDSNGTYLISFLPFLNIGRYYLCSVFYDSKVYVFGGFDYRGYVENSIETLEIVSDVENESNISYDFNLFQNYPNPFNPSTTITFNIKSQSNISLVVFNVTGKKVVTLTDGEFPAGTYSHTWDGLNSSGEPVSSGVYYYRLISNEFIQTKKMLLLR